MTEEVAFDPGKATMKYICWPLKWCSILLPMVFSFLLQILPGATMLSFHFLLFTEISRSTKTELGVNNIQNIQYAEIKSSEIVLCLRTEHCLLVLPYRDLFLGTYKTPSFQWQNSEFIYIYIYHPVSMTHCSAVLHHVKIKPNSNKFTNKNNQAINKLQKV